MSRKRKVALMATALACAAPTVLVAEAADAGGFHHHRKSGRTHVGRYDRVSQSDRRTATPIKHEIGRAHV